MPIISIIIPVYNVEKYLRRCLDSVRNQTFDAWEAVCINDGSPDSSIDILNEYAARDSRFKIISQENGGLSVARNTGLKHARGKYVMYLDSDDFIHPDTMKIAHYLAERDGSDIVSYTYDRAYRPQLMIRYKLGFDIDNAMPRGVRKKYDIDKIKSYLTDDVFAHVTEIGRTKIKWPIKHCQVWKFLVRRDFLCGLEFIPGILYEDIPWWLSLILKHPKVTITELPLYYYFPNFGTSILLSYKELRKNMDKCIGLCAVYELYSSAASKREFDIVSREFLWPFYPFVARQT